MSDFQELVLVIEKQTPAELTTNALAIQAFVAERVKDYTPERYYDDPDAAKKDRAVLNSAAKELNAKRLTVERELMKPLDEFKSVMKATVQAIESASSKLDEIVKSVEETKKNEKRREIEEYFSGKVFGLVPLAQLFDARWLNSTYKTKDWQGDIDAKIDKIKTDLKTLESLEDATDLKAYYLESLDIGAALNRGQTLKANRERVAKEAAERKAREHADKIAVQEVELRQDVEDAKRNAPMVILAAEALEVEVDSTVECTLYLHKATESSIAAVRHYLNVLGVEYEIMTGGF